MNRDRIIQNIEALDAELFSIFRSEFRKQRYSLSLLPQDNASPLVTYLLGSSLSNLHLDYHDAQKHDALEVLAADRAASLFGADEAIVRLASVQVASRMVLLTFLKRGDPILSFHLRKREYCDGDRLAYQFENYSIDPETHELDYDAIAKKAKEFRPKLLIFSPVSYPRTIDYQILFEIAQSVDAYFWVDISQSVGLVAAKLVPSPVPLADVVTFSTRDSLRGPDGAILLTKQEFAARMDAAVINTGHEALHMNHLAALGVVLREAGSESYRTYAEQVVQNAQVLARTLADHGASVLCGGTDTHLVLASTAAGIDMREAVKTIGRMGIRVKPDSVPTMNSGLFLHALRLSTSSPTTRGMAEQDIAYVGSLLAKPLTTILTPEEIETTRQEIVALVKDAPIFDDEWVGDAGE